MKNSLNTSFLSSNHSIFQFDSWRFWESLYSKSIPLTYDFRHWNCELPVIPENGLHYLGVKNLNFENLISKIREMSVEEYGHISETGQAWVLKHYSPKPSAKRLLNLIDLYSTSSNILQKHS